MINKETGEHLYCFPRTFLYTVANLPRAIQVLQALPKEGPNKRYLQEVLCYYGDKKIGMFVQRFNNETTCYIQLWYRDMEVDDFVPSRRVIEISPCDDFYGLNEFGLKTARRHRDFCDWQAMAKEDAEGNSRVIDTFVYPQYRQ